jgi:hypothetical protein
MDAQNLKTPLELSRVHFEAINGILKLKSVHDDKKICLLFPSMKRIHSRSLMNYSEIMSKRYLQVIHNIYIKIEVVK